MQNHNMILILPEKTIAPSLQHITKIYHKSSEKIIVKPLSDLKIQTHKINHLGLLLSSDDENEKGIHVFCTDKRSTVSPCPTFFHLLGWTKNAFLYHWHQSQSQSQSNAHHTQYKTICPVLSCPVKCQPTYPFNGSTDSHTRGSASLSLHIFKNQK